MTTPAPDDSLLEALESGPQFWFRDWPNKKVPDVCAGVYTIWHGPTLVYVGMSGRSLTADLINERRETGGSRHGLVKRLRSHSRGRRSGDQFCVYVADYLVLSHLSRNQIASIASGTRKFDALV